MCVAQPPVLNIGVYFLIVFASGFWMNRSGKPYNAIVLTVHKLVSLAALYTLATTVLQANRAASLNPAEVIAGSVAVLAFIGAIITGGLVSTDRPESDLVSRMHWVTPFLALLSTALTLFLLAGR